MIEFTTLRVGEQRSLSLNSRDSIRFLFPSLSDEKVEDIYLDVVCGQAKGNAVLIVDSINYEDKTVTFQSICLNEGKRKS